MANTHQYLLTVQWTGNAGMGTNDYRNYDRTHTIEGTDKPPIYASSDASFRGDKSKYNPEELFVAAIASCHMLWYLHLCAEAGVIVMEYTDHATGIMIEEGSGGGKFESVTLHPQITIGHQAMLPAANALHEKANELCFIANSCNFPIRHQPTVLVNPVFARED